MATIPLTQGKVALVDAEDYEDLAQFRWVATKCGQTSHVPFQAVRFWKDAEGKRRSEYMHRRLLGFGNSTPRRAHHINGDGLDNRRENLGVGHKPGHTMGRMRARLAPTKSPSMREIYWAAGVYEGEGHFCMPAQVSVAQKDEWLVRELRAYFGGSVRRYWHKGDSRREPMQYWRWNVTGPRARGFILTMYSLLSPRRQEQIYRHFITDSNG